MKILVTPRSFGKCSPEPLEILKKAGCEVVLNSHGRILTKEEMIELIADVDGVIIGLDPLDKDVLQNASQLKAISKYGISTDNIDLDWARKHDISVTLTLGANSDAVADHAMALMLACARQIVKINRLCCQRDWSKTISPDVSGKKLGIFGLGEIGKKIVRRAHGFNMELFAYDEFWDSDFCEKNNVNFATPEEIYKNCDFITIHLPWTEQTNQMIGYEQFKKMKPTAIFINTADSGLVDEKGLVRALQEKRIWAAGIDLFSSEPPENDDLYKLDNLLMTSHCSSSTVNAIDMMGKMAAKNILNKLFYPEKENYVD